MPSGRVLFAALHLLDHQLIDRDGMLAGNVDDLEVEVREDGEAHVVALVAGPGALWRRFDRRRISTWLRDRVRTNFDGTEEDPGRIPMRWVSDLGANVRLSVRRDELATFAGERWVRDHIIEHIPGSSRDADE
jgi:hypothetical protein